MIVVSSKLKGSSNPHYCVLDLCLSFKPNIQNIQILHADLRMHSSGAHCI